MLMKYCLSLFIPHKYGILSIFSYHKHFVLFCPLYDFKGVKWGMQWGINWGTKSTLISLS